MTVFFFSLVKFSPTFFKFAISFSGFSIKNRPEDIGTIYIIVSNVIC